MKICVKKVKRNVLSGKQPAKLEETFEYAKIHQKITETTSLKVKQAELENYSARKNKHNHDLGQKDLGLSKSCIRLYSCNRISISSPEISKDDKSVDGEFQKSKFSHNMTSANTTQSLISNTTSENYVQTKEAIQQDPSSIRTIRSMQAHLNDDPSQQNIIIMSSRPAKPTKITIPSRKRQSFKDDAQQQTPVKWNNRHHVQAMKIQSQQYAEMLSPNLSAVYESGFNGPMGENNAVSPQFSLMTEMNSSIKGLSDISVIEANKLSQIFDRLTSIGLQVSAAKQMQEMQGPLNPLQLHKVKTDHSTNWINWNTLDGRDSFSNQKGMTNPNENSQRSNSPSIKQKKQNDTSYNSGNSNDNNWNSAQKGNSMQTGAHNVAQQQFSSIQINGVPVPGYGTTVAEFKRNKEAKTKHKSQNTANKSAFGKGNQKVNAQQKQRSYNPNSIELAYLQRKLKSYHGIIINYLPMFFSHLRSMLQLIKVEATQKYATFKSQFALLLKEQFQKMITPMIHDLGVERAKAQKDKKEIAQLKNSLGEAQQKIFDLEQKIAGVEYEIKSRVSQEIKKFKASKANKKSIYSEQDPYFQQNPQKHSWIYHQTDPNQPIQSYSYLQANINNQKVTHYQRSNSQMLNEVDSRFQSARKSPISTNKGFNDQYRNGEVRKQRKRNSNSYQTRQMIPEIERLQTFYNAENQYQLYEEEKKERQFKIQKHIANSREEHNEQQMTQQPKKVSLELDLDWHKYPSTKPHGLTEEKFPEHHTLFSRPPTFRNSQRQGHSGRSNAIKFNRIQQPTQSNKDVSIPNQDFFKKQQREISSISMPRKALKYQGQSEMLQINGQYIERNRYNQISQNEEALKYFLHQSFNPKSYYLGDSMQITSGKVYKTLNPIGSSYSSPATSRPHSPQNSRPDSVSQAIKLVSVAQTKGKAYSLPQQSKISQRTLNLPANSNSNSRISEQNQQYPYKDQVYWESSVSGQQPSNYGKPDHSEVQKQSLSIKIKSKINSIQKQHPQRDLQVKKPTVDLKDRKERANKQASNQAHSSQMYSQQPSNWEAYHSSSKFISKQPKYNAMTELSHVIPFESNPFTNRYYTNYQPHLSKDRKQYINPLLLKAHQSQSLRNSPQKKIQVNFRQIPASVAGLYSQSKFTKLDKPFSQYAIKSKLQQLQQSLQRDFNYLK